MAIEGTGLHWWPLYWVMHDQWKWFEPTINGGQAVHNHNGHVHFWMMGFPFGETSGDAFTGFQKYNFAMDDIWGPRSSDANQSLPYSVIGTPKWYFHVQELWRRVYVQQWDEKIDIPQPFIQGRRGIKWDACPPDKRMGPFREGRDWANARDFSPVFIKGARGLPVEYFTSENKVQTERQNYVHQRAGALLGGEFDSQTFDLNHGNFLDCNHPAAKPGFSDTLYINPTLEYQLVVPLNWQRMPGYEAAHDLDADHFGDGWAVQVTVPFTSPLTGKYQSPFGPEPGTVRPAGQYFGTDASGQPLVAPDKRLKYRAGGIVPNPGNDGTDPSILLDLPVEDRGQPISFNEPYGVGDGRWVQQCLGGIVQARAVVTLEHKFGGRQDVWVSSIQYLPATQFAGSDQKSPVPA